MTGKIFVFLPWLGWNPNDAPGTKIAILDFWIYKVPFFFAYFNGFNLQKTTLLNHLQFVFYVTVLRIINKLDSWK